MTKTQNKTPFKCSLPMVPFQPPNGQPTRRLDLLIGHLPVLVQDLQQRRPEGDEIFLRHVRNGFVREQHQSCDDETTV